MKAAAGASPAKRGGTNAFTVDFDDHGRSVTPDGRDDGEVDDKDRAQTMPIDTDACSGTTPNARIPGMADALRVPRRRFGEHPR